MTRFALLTEFFPPQTGGVQFVADGVAKRLGRELTIIASPGGVDVDDQPYSATVIRRSLFSGPGWPRWWWLVGWLRQAQGDGLEHVLFGHFSGAVMAAWVRSYFGLKYSLLLHGNDLLTEQGRWPIRWCLRPLLRRAVWIGVNSAFVADLAVKAGAVESQISFTHPWCDRPVDLAEHHQSARLITVSRLVRRKNIAGVIRAAAQLRTDFPNLRYDIVGDGPERTGLERLVTEFGAADLVKFHGAVSDREKWRLLSAAGIFVMAPLVLAHGVDVEGLGIVYLEAMAAGLPVVASRSGGVSDAVAAGRTGLLIQPGDQHQLEQALRKLLADPQQARTYGQAGQTHNRDEFSSARRLDRMAWRLGAEVPSRPLISVVIPAYQSAGTIGVTLTSIFRQTWSSMEVIVVDDGSTDDLENNLRPWSDRLLFLRQDHQGAPTARNAGAGRANGEFIIFVDADVTLQPEALTSMATVLATRPDASFVYSDFYFGWKKFPLGEYSSARLRRMNYIHTTSLMRRKDFPGFDPALTKFQDWDVWLTMDEAGKKGIWIPRTLFRVQPKRAGRGISTWLPSRFYRLPLIGQGRGSKTIRRYRQAEAIIRQKHHLEFGE